MSMNTKIKKIFENLSYSVGANVLNTLISLILVFIVPKALGVREYAYWQLYTFYTSYIGFFHLGWLDGIYLRFGGKDYRDLDKKYFNTQFWLLVGMELIFTIAIGAISLAFVGDGNKQFVICMTGMCCILQIPRTFLQYLLQITNRVSDYAKNFMLEKVIYAILVLAMLLMGVTDFRVLLIADLIARSSTLILLCRQCKDIVFARGGAVWNGLKEAVLNIRIGIKLLSANIAAMLLTGIVRFAIEDAWSIEVFGKVSLSLTVCNMLMILINAVSVVIYPMLKNTDEEKLKDVYRIIRILLMLPVLGMLIAYYPARVVLSSWLPQYAESLRYMALIFPICIYESKFSLLVCTYLKALRKERDIMWINVAAVVLTGVATVITVYISRDLLATILLLPILMGIRSIVSELLVARYLKISIKKELIWEILLSVVFIVVSWNVQSFWCMIIYAAVYMVFLLSCRNQWKDILEILKAYIKGGKKGEVQ